MVLQSLPVLHHCPAFVKSRVRRVVRKRWLHRLKNRTFTLISNDCWGAEVYRDFNLPYNTPFVGLMLMAPCYLALIRDLKYYLEGELRFKDRSKYDYPNELREKKHFPIGVLGAPGNEVEVHFLHYDSEEEARQKWTRRVARINWQNLVVKFDGSKDYCTDEILAAFDALAFRKVCFTAEAKSNIQSSIHIQDWVADGKTLFKRCLPEFDVADWLNGGTGAVTPGYRLLVRGLRLGETKNR
jgi:uncharacterized protein (DUF1919 family)